jgi:hypothetical protein
VPIVLFFIFSKIDQYLIETKLKQIQNEINLVKQNINKLKVGKNKINNIVVIKYIEKIANNLNIKIINLTINNNTFYIKSTSKYQNMINFISNLETNLKINSLKLTKDKGGNVFMEGKFSVIKLTQNEKINSIKNIPNPFNKTRVYNTTNNKLKLLGIIGENININNKWYKKGDKVGKYTIKSIFKSYIILSYKNKILTLKILKNVN